MCGIVGYVGKLKAKNVLLEGLATLEYRGYDSAGVALFEDGKIQVVKAKGRLSCLEEKIENGGYDFKSGCGIGHTRWATHGEPSDVNSHPHCGKNVALVHNGIIENYMDLREMLVNEGYNFESQTDTEIAAKTVDFCYDSDPIEAVKKAIELLKGAYAFGIMFSDKPDCIYATRKDSPLIIGLSSEQNFIASDVTAILKYTNKYYLLEEGEIAEITKDGVTVTDLSGNKVEKQVHIADWDVAAAEKGGYAHFMLKEIHEQPTAIKNTINPRIKENVPDFTGEGITDDLLKKYNKIHIVACGTAMHAGLVGKNLIEKFAKVCVDVEIASEFRYKDPILSKDDLVVIISQSGETADSLAALRLAKAAGIDTLAVVNVVGSSIAREADKVIYTWAGPEIAVASTKAYSVQVAVMYLLALRLAFVKGMMTKQELEKITVEFCKIPDIISSVLEDVSACEKAADKLSVSDDAFFIGRGIDYSIALEGSLKLKEISYIHSEAYAAGELKHGTISLIEDGIPVIALCTQTNLLEKIVSNIREVKARDAYVIAVCPEDVNLPEDAVDQIVRIPRVDDVLMPLVTVVPLQLISYYTAANSGRDVDKPRNLAKSVTVE